MAAWTSVAEAREHPALAPLDAVADATLADALAAVEQRIERATGVAWTPREAVDVLTGEGRQALTLPRLRVCEVLECEVDGVDVVDDVEPTPSSLLYRRRGVWPSRSRVRVRYMHGADAPPVDLLDAALRATATIVSHARNPRIGERTESVVTEGQTINFSAVADLSRGRPFGMPDVDSVVMAHAVRRVPVG